MTVTIGVDVTIEVTVGVSVTVVATVVAMVVMSVVVAGVFVIVCMTLGVRVVRGAGTAHEQNVDRTAPATLTMLEH